MWKELKKKIILSQKITFRFFDTSNTLNSIYCHPKTLVEWNETSLKGETGCKMIEVFQQYMLYVGIPENTHTRVKRGERKKKYTEILLSVWRKFIYYHSPKFIQRCMCTYVCTMETPHLSPRSRRKQKLMNYEPKG